MKSFGLHGMKLPILHWTKLPSLPDPEGFAAPFTGVVGNSLLVAGGANFRSGRPWNGGTKVWYDQVFLLDEPNGNWSEVGCLSRPTAYGLSFTVPEGIVCVGGGNAEEHFVEASLLTWDRQRLKQTRLPSLPRTCAFMSGAAVGSVLYVAGGIEKPEATEALAVFWALDFAAKDRVWRSLPPCPGPARMLAVAGVIKDTFYLFSGVSLRADGRGNPARTSLHDAYAYHALRGWRRMPDLPHPTVAAASPAPSTRDGRLLVISGDDGTRVHLNGPRHPGFPQEVLGFSPNDNEWTEAGTAPFSRATVPTTQWRSRWIIPNGERIPGYRTPEVWSLELAAAIQDGIHDEA